MIQMVENRGSPAEASPPPGADDLRRRLSRLFTAVEQSRLLANDKMVLKSMIGAASRTGFELNCQQKDIARRARVSEATVSRALRRLIDRELLVERSHFGRKRWILKQERILALPDEPIRLLRPRSRPSPDDETTQAPGAARGRVSPIAPNPASHRNNRESGAGGHQSSHSSPRQTHGEKTDPRTPASVGESIVVSIPAGAVSNGVISLLTQLLEMLTRREAPAPAPHPPLSREDAGPPGHHASAVRPPEPEKASRNASAGGAISRKTSVADDVWSGSFVKSGWVHSGPLKIGLSSWQDKGNKWSVQLHNATAAAVKPVQLQREMHHSIQDATQASPSSSEAFLNNSNTLEIPASSSSSSSTPHPETEPSAPESVKVQGSLRSPEPSQSSGIEVLQENADPTNAAPCQQPGVVTRLLPPQNQLSPELEAELQTLSPTDAVAADLAGYYLCIINDIALLSKRDRPWPLPTALHLHTFLQQFHVWQKEGRDVLHSLMTWHEFLLAEAISPGRPLMPPLQSLMRHIQHLDEHQQRKALRGIQLALHPVDSRLLPVSTPEQTDACQNCNQTTPPEKGHASDLTPRRYPTGHRPLDESYAEYLRLMGQVHADWTPMDEDTWMRPPASPPPASLAAALRKELWHLEEKEMRGWQRDQRHKAQLMHHERDRWIGAPSMRMLLPHLPQYLQLTALRLYRLCWSREFAYLYGPHWPLMDVLAASLFQSRWNSEAQYGPAMRDDSELANLLFSKGDQREKGDLLLRYDDCFLEVGVAPSSVSARILHELIHRRKHLTPGGITLLMGRFSLGKLSELLCSVSPSLEHAMNELLPSLIGDRYFYLGDSDAKKEEAVRG